MTFTKTFTKQPVILILNYLIRNTNYQLEFCVPSLQAQTGACKYEHSIEIPEAY